MLIATDGQRQTLARDMTGALSDFNRGTDPMTLDATLGDERCAARCGHHRLGALRKRRGGMLCETDRRMDNNIFKIANNNESERIYDFGCGAVARCLQ